MDLEQAGLPDNIKSTFWLLSVEAVCVVNDAAPSLLTISEEGKSY